MVSRIYTGNVSHCSNTLYCIDILPVPNISLQMEERNRGWRVQAVLNIVAVSALLPTAPRTSCSNTSESMKLTTRQDTKADRQVIDKYSNRLLDRYTYRQIIKVYICTSLPFSYTHSVCLSVCCSLTAAISVPSRTTWSLTSCCISQLTVQLSPPAPCVRKSSPESPVSNLTSWCTRKRRWDRFMPTALS